MIQDELKLRILLIFPEIDVLTFLMNTNQLSYRNWNVKMMEVMFISPYEIKL